jgi:uncharacterized protein YbjT (DUF2867 family)
VRIVVTGAAGLTGGAIVRELLRRGHEVVGTTSSTQRVRAIAELGAEPAVVDNDDPGSLAAAIAPAEALVHVAGIRWGERIAASGVERLSRVVVISTAAIYASGHPSAAIYLRGEAALRGSAPGALFVRPTMIYGSPRDRNVHRVIAFARRWRSLPLPDGGHARIQPIHYEDLARATAALVGTSASGVVDAGGPAPLTLAQAARAIFEALGRPAVLLRVPTAAALPVARIVDAATGSRWAERLLRSREDRVVDNGRLLELTGVTLRSFHEGARDEVAEMRRRSWTR